MSNPTFSIIIPSHNGADRIHEALDSCAEQTFTDYEIIVVCDACSDNTAEIARQYTPHVIEVDLHRDGLARNAGIDIASGDWILFLDDDDWLLHEFVLYELSRLAKDPVADVINFAVVWRTVGIRGNTYGHYLPMVAGHCWRRSFVGDVRFSDARYSSDTDFLKRLIAKIPTALWCAMPMYYYNFMREGSLSDLHKKGMI